MVAVGRCLALGLLVLSGQVDILSSELGLIFLSIELRSIRVYKSMSISISINWQFYFYFWRPVAAASQQVIFFYRDVRSAVVCVLFESVNQIVRLCSCEPCVFYLHKTDAGMSPTANPRHWESFFFLSSSREWCVLPTGRRDAVTGIPAPEERFGIPQLKVGNCQYMINSVFQRNPLGSLRWALIKMTESSRSKDSPIV